MTPEEAKQILPIITAFSEGKTIQVKMVESDEWKDLIEPHFNKEPSDYRIKPESAYRPYNHNDFDIAAVSHHNTVRDSKSGLRLLITAWNDTGWKNPLSQTIQKWEYLLSDFVWNDDGSPCGVLTDNNE